MMYTFHKVQWGRKGTGQVAVVSIFTLMISILTTFNLSAQKNSDIGVFAGTSYYMGDLNPSVHYSLPAFAIGPIYRYNFNPRNSLRAHGFYHGLAGSYSDYIGYNSDNVTPEFASKFVDLGLDFEFNWKPYKTAYRKTKSSPYIFGGIGYGFSLQLSEGINGYLTMPFGVGYKLNLGRWTSAGVEMSARKTFTDRIDGISNLELANRFVPFGNRDWYFFTGVFVTYKIFKFWDTCPAYDQN